MEKSNQNLIAAIEAILFVYGEPLSIKKIVKILSKKSGEKIDENSAKDAVAQLEQKYLSEDGGLKLLQISSGSDMEVQLVSKPEFSSFLEDFIKEEFKEQLTPASLEVLALVMYFGPISKSQIDYYRGVNSSFILRNLLMRGLVDRGFDPKRSNAYLYSSSFDLLKYLGLSKVEDLPEFEKFKVLNNDTNNTNTTP